MLSYEANSMRSYEALLADFAELNYMVLFAFFELYKT